MLGARVDHAGRPTPMSPKELCTTSLNRHERGHAEAEATIAELWARYETTAVENADPSATCTPPTHSLSPEDVREANKGTATGNES